MLALKVHKGKHSNTKFGSFWIPIVDWRTARIHLKNWSTTMARLRAVRYLTMIRVPNRHPVFVAVDWSSRFGIPLKQLPFVPLCDIEKSVLAALKPLPSALPEAWNHVDQGYFIGARGAGMPSAEYPEMVLGADLPDHFKKWTKDIRLLMRGDTREAFKASRIGKRSKPLL
jgi:hypothetical protein